MEDIPADLILLWSSEGAQAYVETANIDGETNLKIKKPASDDQDHPIISSMDQAKGTNFSVEFEPPNGKVHTFEGTLRPQDAPEIPLDATNFLLRGSVLRHRAGTGQGLQGRDDADVGRRLRGRLLARRPLRLQAGRGAGEPQGPRGDDLRHGLPGAARRAGQRPGPGGG